MKRIAGIVYPCFDCQHNARICRKRVDIQKAVFFAVGTRKEVSCSDYEEERYHGLEGVKA